MAYTAKETSAFAEECTTKGTHWIKEMVKTAANYAYWAKDSTATWTGAHTFSAAVTFSSTVGISGAITATNILALTRTNQTTAENGIYSYLDLGSAWTTGSMAAVRGKSTVSATTGSVGNAYGGWFGYGQTSAFAATGLGLTCGVYAEASNAIAGAAPSAVAYFQSVVTGAGVNTNMPILVLTSDGGSNSDKSAVAIEFGYAPAATTVSTGSAGMFDTTTLRVKVNGSIRYIPLSTATNTYTTAAKIITTCSDPDAAYNGVYTTISQANTYSGSIAGNRTTLTCSSTGPIGNMYAGRFELIQSVNAASQGHTCALYAQTTSTGAANNPTSVLSLCLAGASGGVSTPFINFLDASTTKTTCLFEIGTGNNVGTGTSGTALYETSASIGNVDEITAGLRVKVNGVDYYLLMATPTDIQD